MNMPLEVGIWKVNGNQIQKIDYQSIDNEQKLEDILFEDISVLGDEYLLIGRQLRTSYGKIIDLVSINDSGKITVIELKRNKTPRDVVAQALDYASWIQDLSYDEIKNIFEDQHDKSFEESYENKFGSPPPEKINQEHDMIIVCSEIDNETERILNYLSDNYNVPINVVFFRFFKEQDSEFISRSWLISPTEVEEKASKSKTHNKSEPWNGKDFIVNVDASEDGISSWDDCRKYNFISAGGGKWYSRSLSVLQPGHRVFAMIPKKGYVGVGIVTEKSIPIKEFDVPNENGVMTNIFNVPLKCEGIKSQSEDLENCEYFVSINWIKEINEEKAFWVKGLRANQNSAFKLRNKFTLEKLIEHFSLDE
jgi:hypothetical protein